MPLQQTSGNDTSDAYGGGAAVVANYIEDVFSTYLYAGSASAQTITNGIDLANKGGMVWIKDRTLLKDHVLEDTSRGARKLLFSNLNSAQVTADGITAFNSNGFDLNAAGAKVNESGSNYVSWTFRKQPKFFDVVTYTGTGAAQNIAHSLGAVPRCVMVKRTDSTGNWQVYHNSLTSAAYSIQLNSTAAQGADATVWNSTAPTASVFTVGTALSTNASAGTYVAYIFASNAGGFGLAGTDNVITCGSFTTDASGIANVTLGYEPQFVLVKPSSTAGDWLMLDTMRGFTVSAQTQMLKPNTTAAEANLSADGGPNATGFAINGIWVNTTLIYIAIRRGPMKKPTTGTSVFYPLAQTGNADNTSVGFSPDWTPFKIRNGAGNWAGYDRLRGVNQNLQFNTTAAESTVATIIDGWLMNGVDFGSGIGGADQVYVPCFKRAPGFFDEVCYTGTGANATQSHNLGVVPEMMIVKKRSAVTNWAVYHSALTAAGYALLNTTAASTTASTFWQSTTPTATNFYIGTNGNVGDAGATYVAYLFATCAGVSKVGSYTGTGATQTISCGFTGGARFVLVKRTDTTGDWYVWDTARGMVSGTDPSLLLNTTAAEVNANSIYTATGGFQIVSTAAGINASGGTYIFLAIA